MQILDTTSRYEMSARRLLCITHGFKLSDAEADILLASYAENTTRSGEACVERDQLIEFLPDRHRARIYAAAVARLGLDVDAYTQMARQQSSNSLLPREPNGQVAESALTRRLATLVGLQLHSLHFGESDSFLRSHGAGIGTILFNAAINLSHESSAKRTLSEALAEAQSIPERQELIARYYYAFHKSIDTPYAVINSIMSRNPSERFDLFKVALTCAQPPGYDTDYVPPVDMPNSRKNLVSASLQEWRELLPDTDDETVIAYLDSIADFFDIQDLDMIRDIENVCTCVVPVELETRILDRERSVQLSTLQQFSQQLSGDIGVPQGWDLGSL